MLVAAHFEGIGQRGMKPLPRTRLQLSRQEDLHWMTSTRVPCTTPDSVNLFLSGRTLVAGAAAWAQRLFAGVLVKVLVGSRRLEQE